MEQHIFALINLIVPSINSIVVENRDNHGLIKLGKKRGLVEEWLKRIKWGGCSRDYVIYIRHRRCSDNVEDLRPIPGNDIADVRRGYIILKNGEYIPFHRVEEIKFRDGRVLYSRRSV